MNHVFSQKVLYMKNGISKKKKKGNMSRVKRTGVTAAKVNWEGGIKCGSRPCNDNIDCCK